MREREREERDDEKRERERRIVVPQATAPFSTIEQWRRGQAKCRVQERTQTHKERTNTTGALRQNVRWKGNAKIERGEREREEMRERP